MKVYKYIIKEIMDRGIALCFFLLFIPVFLFVMFLLFIIQGRRIFFTQLRPGKGGNLFRIIKFKTMNDRKDENGELLPDDKRLTKIGKIVRKLSLDEIPQLLNVIKGDMSIVGPRPLLPEYLELYNDFQNRRHEVKPGITGWAQVNGRNAISWEDKFNFDVWYVDNISFFTDLKILFLTVKKVLVSEGISSESSVTMEKFKGNTA